MMCTMCVVIAILSLTNFINSYWTNDSGSSQANEKLTLRSIWQCSCVIPIGHLVTVHQSCLDKFMNEETPPPQNDNHSHTSKITVSHHDFQRDSYLISAGWTHLWRHDSSWSRKFVSHHESHSTWYARRKKSLKRSHISGWITSGFWVEFKHVVHVDPFSVLQNFGLGSRCFVAKYNLCRYIRFTNLATKIRWSNNLIVAKKINACTCYIPANNILYTLFVHY